MIVRFILLVNIIAMLVCSGCGETVLPTTAEVAPQSVWKINDINRPKPTVLVPGVPGGHPPSNAIVLFDGKDTSEWFMTKDAPEPIRWKVENGYMEVVKETGSLQTKRAFGDCQLHLEWATPRNVEGEGQFRGNSGVFLMSRYEVQILDSYQNPTYPDGQAGAIYADQPPMFNASRKPGKWQSYDIIFRRPRFDAEGKLVKPGYITVLHNGIVVQDHHELKGTLQAGEPGPDRKLWLEYIPHPDKMPLILQDHLNPVRFRNIWIVELPEEE